MKTIFLFAAILLTGLASANAITLDEIIQRSIEARGGAAKIEALKTLTMEGTISMSQGMEMKTFQYFKRPNKMRMDMSIQGMNIVQAFDGATAWAVNPMNGNTPTKLDGKDADAVADRATLDGYLSRSKEKGHSMKLVGAEDLDGSTAYRIDITDEKGEVSSVYVDATTWLETKVRSNMSMMGQEAEVEIVFDSYQSVAGVMIPMVIEMRTDGRLFLATTFTNPKPNVDIPDARFAFPASGNK